MKKRLNILCVLVFVLLASTLVPFGMMMVDSVKQGIELAKQGDLEGKQPEEIMKVAKVKHPTVISAIPIGGDPVLMHNDKTGRDVEVWPTQMLLDSGLEHNAGLEWGISAAGIVVSVLQMAVLVLFVLLIVRVNDGHIFTWRNVRLLRIMGASMLMAGVISIASVMLLMSQAIEVFHASGYVINYVDYTQLSNLILGVLALIVAEVFAIGLKQKEELELTV